MNTKSSKHVELDDHSLICKLPHRTKSEDDTLPFVKNILPKLKYLSTFIILILIIGLVITIFIKLYTLFFSGIANMDFNSIIHDLLFTLILMELFTILYSYLQKNYIKVERVIELGIISIVREMLFKIEVFESSKIYAVSVLLVALGLLFFIEKYYSTVRNV